MITTGSKWFYGLGLVSLVLAAAYGWTTGGNGLGPVSVGYKGGVGDHFGYTVLFVAAVISFGLGIASLAMRDADPEAQAQVAGVDQVPTVTPAGVSYWPVVGAFGVAAYLGLGTVYLLNRTRFGSHVFIVGDNATSAELMGIRVARVKITTYCIVGVVAAFAGLVSSTQVSFLWPTLGDGHLLTAIAAVVLGGTSIFGGSGSIVGTFVGAFVVGSINAGVISAGIDGFYTQLFFGLVIIVSLVIQTLIRKRMQG